MANNIAKKKLTVEGLAFWSKVCESGALFEMNISSEFTKCISANGFGGPRELAWYCMQWTWCQWLANGDPAEIRKRVAHVVDRGLKAKQASSHANQRHLHDLYLLNCAIFASNATQLDEVATSVMDSSGFDGHGPKDNGDLYLTAWCGMLKHWILGDRKKAMEESQVVWKSYRDLASRVATKPLATPWLKEDWAAFARQQAKDFDKLWERAHRGHLVVSENRKEITVDLGRMFSFTQWGFWAHCGLAMLAHRKGAKVATDPFWFPPHALNCVDVVG